MKKIVSGLTAFLLVFVNLGAILQNSVIYLDANEITTNNEVQEETINNETIVEETTIDETINSDENQINEEVITEPEVNNTRNGITTTALITLSGDATYQAGTTVTSNQLLLDANINLLGIHLGAGLDLSTVNFGVPGTYTVTALGLNALGICNCRNCDPCSYNRYNCANTNRKYTCEFWNWIYSISNRIFNSCKYSCY